ncbi:transposase domain-containing protein [Caulobacter vibrioides]
MGRSRQRPAILYSLIVTAKMNSVDPQAWLAESLVRLWRASRAKD